MNQYINPNLKIIRDEVLACTKCPLSQTRHFPMIGQGNHKAKIVFIGEAPGYNEDQTGRPFQGSSGKVFDELLCSIKLKREEVYICNILKCRPPKNRDPLPNEIEACTPYLMRQLKEIQPEIVCCLGNFSTRFIMKLFGIADQCAGMTKVHGNVFEVKNSDRKLKIIPLYHPASVNYNPNMMDTLKIDFQKIKEI